MERKNFAQILRDAGIDYKKEYDRLYGIFIIQKLADGNGGFHSLKDYCAANFTNMPFRQTCISLDDFEVEYKLFFERVPSNFDLNYLLSFCEYSYNLTCYIQNYGFMGMTQVNTSAQFYLAQVNKVIDMIGYMGAVEDGVTIFVPKDSAAISVSEIIKPELSYKVLEYNHHSMSGAIQKKKEILKLLADDLESKQDDLKRIDTSLKNDLFFLFNNLNIRHNNIDSTSPEYHQEIEEMPEKSLEEWYDDTYQMCLLAYMTLDNIERKTKVKQLRKTIKGGE